MRERGNALIIALIALTGLASLGGLTVLAVQGGIATSSSDRFKTIALYAAETGAASSMDWLRKQVVVGGTTNATNGWTAFVSANNASPPSPGQIPGNGRPPGDPGNLMSPEMNAWFEVQILNDRADPGFTLGQDQNSRILLRVTGHGPDGASAQVEWDIAVGEGGTLSTPCPSYAQKGIAEDDAGRNDCLTSVNSTQTATYRPGGP
ncbi:MAG: pilus assembly PilX N-terminal domain-containing protein [Deltaproteobacteria bacterium]|nr:pilus assembly PilX N-terminal domain-containing protein [Deltaproteobacteria bacterium]